MQAISTKTIQRAEPSQKLVFLAAGALLAILCLVVLVAATLNGGAAPTRTVVNPPASAVGSTDSGDSGDHSQPDHGYIP